jgi:hypothetical protein
MSNHYTVLGLYKKVETTVNATPQIVDEFGIVDGDIEVMTSAAYPDDILIEDKTLMHQVHQRQYLFPFLLGIVGMISAITLVGGTGWIMNLNVGGKAPFAYPPTGIIAYEFSLLFAVIGSVISLLLFTGLPNWTERAYDADITDGSLGILIKVNSREDQDRAAEMMTNLGAYKVKKGENDF